jgi:hypothetical protein
MSKAGAAHALVVTHGRGLGRRNWELAFVHRGGEGWSARRRCAVPHVAEDWTELEGALAELLREAATRLDLRADAGEEALLGMQRGAWAALGEALSAERQDRFEDALAVLEDVAGNPPPIVLLGAFYGAVQRVRRTGQFGEPSPPPAEGLPPQMAALSDALRAVAAGEPAAVQESLGAYLSRFPRSARGYYLLGLWRLHARERPAEALLALRHAAGLDPAYLPATHACVDVLLRTDPEGVEAFVDEFAATAPDAAAVEDLRDYARRRADQ